MIVLYHLIPGPSGDCGVYGSVAVDEHPGRRRWWATFAAAEIESRDLCRKIGERPRPGFQHTRPVPVVVIEKSYLDHLDVARGKKISQKEVHRRWALADGSFTDQDPEKVNSHPRERATG